MRPERTSWPSGVLGWWWSWSGPSLEETKAALPAGLLVHAEAFADPRGVIGLRAPAVLVADEWGEVFFASRADRVEDLPGPEDLRDWAVFVAIQCPECEAPEGGWKTL